MSQTHGALDLQSGTKKKRGGVKMFNFEVKDLVDGTVTKVGDKIMYNSDKAKKASEWIRDGVPTRGGSHEFVKLSSAIKAKTPRDRGTMFPGALGYFYSGGNIVEKNPIAVALFSTTFSNGNGVSIFPNNFSRVCMLFSARKLIKSNWLNGKDEYLVPDETHEKFAEFSYDSIIYSHFHGSANQSSLRGIEYDGKPHNVFNQFFFMSAEEIKDLADEHSNEAVYSDVNGNGAERFTNKLLEQIELSNEVSLSAEAQAVLTTVKEIAIKTFKYRKDFDKAKPEYHINSWDAGWYQIRGLADWIIKNGLDKEVETLQEQFKQQFTTLADKMQPLVYDLGFLPSH